VPLDLDWDGCVNVRDLGGFATPTGDTAFGVFVRADNARKLTAAGWRSATEYGIRTVLDLRSEAECAADPPAHADFTHTRLSLFEVLFHCVGGKDRTGMLTVLLLRLVGVAAEEVDADYVRSETRLERALDRVPGLNITPRGVIDQVVGAIEMRYGGVAEYLLQAGVPPERLDRIRATFALGS